VTTIISIGNRDYKEAVDFAEVIDFHAHIGPWLRLFINDPWEDHLIKIMDLLGINRICISSLAAVGADAVLGNDITYRAMQKYPERIIGFAVIDPRRPREAGAELGRCIKCLGMKGVKIHPSFYEYPVDGQGYLPAFAYAEDHGLPLLIHTDYSSPFANPLKAIEVSLGFPALDVVLAHAGLVEEGFRVTLEAARDLPRIHLDFTSRHRLFGLVERFVAEVGASRVIFATDMPYHDPRSALGRVVFADLDDGDKANILGLNALRLLNHYKS